MNWAFLDTSSGHEFVTSDLPAVFLNHDSHSRITFSANIMESDIEICLPISPRRAVFICRKEVPARRLIADKILVRRVNKNVVGFAERFVLASFRDPTFMSALFRKTLESRWFSLDSLLSRVSSFVSLIPEPDLQF